jgi:hypothetical protein
LLGLAALVCFSLGGWHLLETYGNRLDVDEVRIGAPIRIEASYVWLFGPEKCNLVVGYAIAGDSGSISKYLRVKRSWLCLYSVESDFDPVDRPCQIIIYFRRYSRFGRGFGRKWTLKEKIVDVK